ncbi:hypothetical protein ABBQ38_009244 [Trebouxia sp. C0009 RCD-2024]
MSRTSDTGTASWAEYVVVTGTGFFGRDRQQIRHLVQSCGGTYSGDLLLDHTTHVVYKDLNLAKRGEKYATALSWGIPVLPFSWLQDSAQCRCILPDTYKPNMAEPATASPATKMQRLCLQEDTLCHPADTARRLLKPNLQHRTKPHAEARPSPQDIASQVKGQHRMLHSSQDSQEPASVADALDLLSCVGSCQPDLTEDILTQSPGAAVGPEDTSDSDTCSDRCNPAGSVQQLLETGQAPAPATAAALAGDAHNASLQASTREIILPDSQPEDSTLHQAGQQLASAVTEAEWPEATHRRSSHGQDTIPDSPLETTVPAHLAVKHPQTASPGYASADAVCKTESSWQGDNSPGPQPAALLDGDAAAEGDCKCEAVPDTEMQVLPSSPVDMPLALQPGIAAVSSSHVSSTHALVPRLLPPQPPRQHAGHQQSQHAPSVQHPQQEQHQQEQQQQEQQQQQQQLLVPQPPQTDEHQEADRLSLADSVAQGSPSTSYASRAFVIEDSDDESDFQPYRPARPSTGSSHSHAHPTCSKLGCHRYVKPAAMVACKENLSLAVAGA